MLLKVQLHNDAVEPGAPREKPLPAPKEWQIVPVSDDILYTDRAWVPNESLVSIREGGGEDFPDDDQVTFFYPRWVSAGPYRYHQMVSPVRPEDGSSLRWVVACYWQNAEGVTQILHADGAVYLMSDAGETIERL